MPDNKNHLGLPTHPTDAYVHWSDSVDKMHELRRLWDEALAGSEKALEALLEEAYSKAMTDAEEDRAGEDM